MTIDIGIQVYKSGIPAQYLPELGKKVLQMSNLELVGLHFHGGRHDPSLNALSRPATILVNGKDAEIIRRAETIEDVFRRDVIPERLIRRKKYFEHK